MKISIFIDKSYGLGKLLRSFIQYSSFLSTCNYHIDGCRWSIDSVKDDMVS